MWNLTELPIKRRARPERRWSEAELAEAWQFGRHASQWLVDCCGRHLRVVFPGRRWGGPGPDFVGAVLAQADGVLIHGDVEVHPRASSWASHRHARDPAYQNVVLHVVQQCDGLALDAQGRHIPTVELVVLDWSWPTARPVAVPCVRAAAAVREVVEAAGHERFRARAARFEADLTQVEPDQAVWRGVCEALGYRRNTRPFGQLADAVTWALAAQTAVDRGPVGLAGLLLGTSGLLAEATLPEAHAWRALQRSLGVRPALRSASWDRCQLRARNAPAWRCRGLAELGARWAAARWAGPAEQVLEAVRQAARLSRPRLWPLVNVAPWVGRGRAQVVVINVLLPFAAAAGVAEAEGVFERLPGEPSNRIVRYMAQQLGDSQVPFRGACQQQGLLQLFQGTCATRECERCPARASSSATILAPRTSKS